MDTILRNAWYMAAWADEVGEALFARRLLGRPVLMYRTGDGTAVALEDRCPHRFTPLSLGRRDGDDVICAYHGLRFDAGGRCIGNPFSDRIPAGATVRRFPLVERDTILWLWAGDADAADPALIPDFACLIDRADNRTVHGHMPLAAPYEYGTDNLMDLSHIEFVHRGSFAGNGVIFAGTHKVVQEGETLHSNWWMPDIPPPSMAHGVYPEDARVDHWLDMRWNAPAAMYLQVGAVPAGAPRATGHIVHQAHVVTPETPHSSHYFWASSRSNDVASPEVDAFLRGLFGQAFGEEDKPIIEASYANTGGGDFWAQQPVFLGIDAGGTRARRLLEGLIRAEQGLAARKQGRVGDDVAAPAAS